MTVIGFGDDKVTPPHQATMGDYAPVIAVVGMATVLGIVSIPAYIGSKVAKKHPAAGAAGGAVLGVVGVVGIMMVLGQR